ncbi:GAF domain-containing sensor histidine kinase [Pleurocapsales cyanobacterium LEGE 06147]|nr:GAF domain-containing sensor histidine kinase [Pleurocapsales cyanobacterium LEGE 06147]
MSHPYIAASSEFAALCQSQMNILERGLGAVWSAVYLREEVVENQQARLIPFAIYPETEENWQKNFSPLKLPEFWYQLKYQPRLLATLSLPSANEPQTAKQTDLQEKYLGRQQLILPLIYEDVVMGLLVTGREDRDWNEQELNQIEEIAQTLAIACRLDRRNQLYRKQLAAQQNLRQIEQDRVDILLHQLRNPLTALRTFSKLLIKRLLPDDRNQSVAKNILRESDRLQELLQQFEAEIDNQETENAPLTLSAASVRLSEEDTPIQSNFLLPGNSFGSQSVQIKDVLEPLSISAEAIAAERKIKWTANIPENLPSVAANAKALREVLNNLIDNALKYTPPGGRVELSVETRPEESILGIAISDTGYGIAPEDREHIFEHHYRGIQAKGDIPGSGLGLAIAKELLEQMQGKIELISPNDLARDTSFPGTTFIVWLPLSANSQQSPVSRE